MNRKELVAKAEEHAVAASMMTKYEGDHKSVMDFVQVNTQCALALAAVASCKDYLED